MYWFSRYSLWELFQIRDESDAKKKGGGLNSKN